MTSEASGSDHDAVSAANAAFYGALEQGDLELMMDVWARGDDVVCTHPGRAALRGWNDVLGSWQSIFAAGGNPQIIVTEEHVTIRGDVAWVGATENMISGGQTGVAMALNIFERADGGWRMLVHHAGPVVG